jgi:hypothetical protein
VLRGLEELGEQEDRAGRLTEVTRAGLAGGDC